MIEADGLSRRYGDRLAVDQLRFQVPAGRTVGLLGANGAGKTTTLEMLATLLRPSEGTARVAGCDVRIDPLGVRRRVGYVPEHGAVPEGLTAREYLELAALAHDLDPAEGVRRGQRLLRHLALEAPADDRLASYSKGMRRKVLIAAALLHDPPVLLLDEPMDGLDVPAQRLLADLLVELARAGKTVLYSSHVLPQVEAVCAQVLLIDAGRLLWSGDVATLRAEHDGRPLTEVFLAMTCRRDGPSVAWGDLLAGDR